MYYDDEKRFSFCEAWTGRMGELFLDEILDLRRHTASTATDSKCFSGKCGGWFILEVSFQKDFRSRFGPLYYCVPGSRRVWLPFVKHFTSSGVKDISLLLRRDIFRNWDKLEIRIFNINNFLLLNY